MIDDPELTDEIPGIETPAGISIPGIMSVDYRGLIYAEAVRRTTRL